jgi:hypothetical protein
MGRVNRKTMIQASMSIKARPYSKNNENKRGGGMAQGGAHLPGKHKVLSSSSSIVKRKEYMNWSTM